MMSEDRVWKFPQIGLLNDSHSNIFPILNNDVWKKNTSQLAVVLGLGVIGNPIVEDLGSMQNLLITGKEGVGKTSLISTILATLLLKNSPVSLRLVILDSSRTDLTCFNGLPHLLSPVITDQGKGISALRWTLAEIDRRHKLISEAGVKNIEAYNEMSGFQALPYIALFIDDYSEMHMFSPVEYEDSLAAIYKTGKRAGIYTVIATTKSIKVIADDVQSKINFSLNEKSLLAPHDYLLIKNRDSFPICIQCPILSSTGIQNIVTFINKQKEDLGFPDETPTVAEAKKFSSVVGDPDDLFEDAVKIVCQYDRASAAPIQRRLSIGYARAARIIDQLEAAKVISASDGSSKPREVLVQDAEAFISEYKQHKNGV